MRYSSSKRKLVFGTAVCLGTALAVAITLTAFASGKTSAGRHKTPAVSGEVRLTHPKVTQGRMVHGEIVFHNYTNYAKILVKGCKVDGLFAVTIDGRASRTTDDPAFSAVGCTTETALVAKPGVSAYHFKELATYQQCSEDKTGKKGTKYWAPHCVGAHDDKLPPLPAGSYRSQFVPNGKLPKGVHVKAATLKVIRARHA